jgi:hypothetical protein
VETGRHQCAHSLGSPFAGLRHLGSQADRQRLATFARL